MSAIDGIVTTSLTMKSFVHMCLLYLGPHLRRIGICFVRRARSYSERVNSLEKPLDTMIVIIIGKKMSIDDVVSNMISNSEYVSPVYPANIAPAPRMTGVT